MVMDEIWVAIIGLVIALAIVGIIHWLIVGNVNIGSDTHKVILSLEVVAFVCLMATFVLGNYFKIAERVMPGHNDIALEVGLTWHDTFIVLGTLLGSLLIYKAITYFLKWSMPRLDGNRSARACRDTPVQAINGYCLTHGYRLA